VTIVLTWIGAAALVGMLLVFVPGLRPRMGRLALVAIGLVFIAAGLLKALNPEGFTEAVQRYGLIPDALAPAVTWTLLPLEMALGVALVLDWWRGPVVAATVVLLVGFLGLVGYTAATGGDVSECGCFGSLVERTAAEVVVEDLGFIALALLGMLAAPARRRHALRGAVVLVAAVATLGYMPFAADIPVERLETWLAREHGMHLSLVTRLSPGLSIDELHVSVPDAAFSEGRHLVALLDLEHEDVSGPAVDELNRLVAEPGAPGVAVLYANEEDVKDGFFWSWAPSYPMYRILPEEMRGLYRRLPRYFLVEDGVVKDVWNNMPEADAVREAAVVQVQEMSH
jgi:hypothetical protein